MPFHLEDLDPGGIPDIYHSVPGAAVIKDRAVNPAGAIKVIREPWLPLPPDVHYPLVSIQGQPSPPLRE